MKTSLALNTFCCNSNYSPDISLGKSGRNNSSLHLSPSLAMSDAVTCAY